jgi:FAD:protein FMN transferase
VLWTETVMGMPFTVQVRGEARQAVLDEVFTELRMIDALFSPFIAESAVSRINSGQLDAGNAGPLVREVIELCERYGTETNGYFAAWAFGRFDPTGLVKGWAIARACAILERAGYRDYFVDGAGDVRTRGVRERGVPWRVGIRHPFDRNEVVMVLDAPDLAVATSGTYEKGAHVRDPHTGETATDLLSVTVVGPSIVAADVYATAAFAMGRGAIAFIETVPGYEAYALDQALGATWTRGLPAHRAHL